MSSTTQRSSGGRRLRRRLMLPLVLLVAIAVQFPVILVVGHLSGHRNVVMAFGALWTAGFVSSFVGPRSVWASPSRVRLYAVLWPFFLWWTVSLLLIVLSPLALVARLALPLTSQSPSQLQSQWLLQGWLVAAIIGAAVALWQRPRIRRHVVYVDGLPASFDGYRVAQISDLHCGPF
ncbi:MAG: hypothetical protein ABJA82_04175, partial [Myxococcales bacterium]